jgi:hypothetical protein
MDSETFAELLKMLKQPDRACAVCGHSSKDHYAIPPYACEHDSGEGLCTCSRFMVEK